MTIQGAELRDEIRLPPSGGPSRSYAASVEPTTMSESLASAEGGYRSVNCSASGSV